MQVIGVNTITRTQNTRRVKKTSASSIFSLNSADAAEAVTETFEADDPNTVSSLLAIHSFKEKIDLEKKSEAHSESLLRNMDDMVRNIAANRYSASESLSRLSKSLSDQRDRSDNAELEQLVDEVELLALVEKAKLQKNR